MLLATSALVVTVTLIALELLGRKYDWPTDYGDNRMPSSLNRQWLFVLGSLLARG